MQPGRSKPCATDRTAADTIGCGWRMPLKTSPPCPFATAWERRCSNATSHDPRIFPARACPALRQAATVPGRIPLQGRRLLP